MVTVKDVPAQKLVEAVASYLKEKKLVNPPEWAIFVKTGTHKERPPMNKDWWYIRSASILRSIYLNGPVGVSKLRSKYGGRKNRGRKPERFKKGSGSIIRKILQQLQAAKLIDFTKEGVRKGRVITPSGTSVLNKAAASVAKK
jgi:small subunit ribosomal protein S19e